MLISAHVLSPLSTRSPEPMPDCTPKGPPDRGQPFGVSQGLTLTV
jgi:hypothetical protein